MFNFAKIADPDFEGFVRTYNLPAFVELKRVCEVVNIGRTKLYDLHGKGKLTIRNIGGKRGVFATEIFELLRDAPSIGSHG